MGTVWEYDDEWSAQVQSDLASIRRELAKTPIWEDVEAGIKATEPEHKPTATPILDAPLSFISGEYKPEITKESGLLDRISEYFKQDVSQATEFMVGATADLAKKAQVGEEPSVMDYSMSGLEMMPMAGLMTKGTKMFRGGKGEYKSLEDIRSLKESPEEFGMHVSIDPDTAAMFSERGTGGISKMEFVGDNPIYAIDTDADWYPDRTINTILRDKRNTKLTAKDRESLEDISYDYKDAVYEAEEFNNMLYSKYSRGDISAKEASDKKALSVYEINLKYNKKIQAYLDKKGYDHISYINTSEGPPVESAIVWNKDKVRLLESHKYPSNKSAEDTLMESLRGK
jgi:hypothetical protein